MLIGMRAWHDQPVGGSDELHGATTIQRLLSFASAQKPGG
jgi:hypothetical protein